MPYKDPVKEKERSLKRREYFVNRYHRLKKLGLWKVSKKYCSLNSIGYRGEIEALDILKGAKRINHPCDLNWDGKMVDVKTSRVIKNTYGYRWKFLLKKQKGKVDLFLLICNDLDNKVKYVLLIPDKEIKFNNISISESNLYKYSYFLLTL